MMNNDELVDLFLEMTTLKRMPRTGWLTRGVPHVESVADHSYGVAFVALALAAALSEDSALDGDLDLEKVLVMATLHDLAEVRLTDLPLHAARLISGPVKRGAEATALSDLLAPLPGAGRLEALWCEFEDRSSPEGRLVRDADKLEMMVQCLRYELSGSRGLDEYWSNMDHHEWHFALCGDLYARLKDMRRGELGAEA